MPEQGQRKSHSKPAIVLPFARGATAHSCSSAGVPVAIERQPQFGPQRVTDMRLQAGKRVLVAYAVAGEKVVIVSKEPCAGVEIKVELLPGTGNAHLGSQRPPIGSKV